MPSPLTVFCPDQPAVARELNTNFKQLTDWAIQKTGALGTPNITTTGAIAAGGALSGATLSTTGTVSAGGAISGASLALTSDLTARQVTASGRLVANNIAPSLADWNTASVGFAGGAGIVNDNVNTRR